MNFNSVFEELNKLYEEAPKAEEVKVEEEDKAEEAGEAVEEACGKKIKESVTVAGNKPIATDYRPRFEKIAKDVDGIFDFMGDLVVYEDGIAVALDRKITHEELSQLEKAMSSTQTCKQENWTAEYTNMVDDSTLMIKFARNKKAAEAYNNNLKEGREFKDPRVSKILDRVKKHADAEGIEVGLDHIEAQTDLLKKWCSDEELALLRNVELSDGTVVCMLKEAADEEEVEIVDEEPVEEEIPTEVAKTVEDFITGVSEYDGKLKLEFKPIVIDGNEYPVTGVLWDDTIEEGKLVAEVVFDVPEEADEPTEDTEEAIED